jgi:hypothetical protein
MPNENTSWGGSCTAAPESAGGTGVQLLSQQRRTPANPYAQVALTYVRRARSLARIGFLIAGGVIFLLCLIMSLFLFFHDSLPCLLMLATALFILIAVHLKEQFAAPRSHLMPDFRRVHATVAGVAALILAVVLPALLTWLAGWRSVGLVAVVVSLLGTVFWMVLLDAYGWAWLGWASIVTALFFSRLEMLDLAWLWSGQFEIRALVLLLFGVVATVLGGVRLVRLDETMRGYPRQAKTGAISSQAADSTVGDGPALFGRLNRWLHDAQMATSTRHARRAPASRWSSVRRWQAGMIAGWPGWLESLGGILSSLLLLWIIGFRRIPLTVFLMCSILMPAGSSVGILIQRIHTLRYELLLPVERDAYLKQLGKAVALSHIQVWVAANVAMIAWWLGTVPESFPIAGVVSVLAISASFQVFLFGLALLLALQGSEALGPATVIVAAVPLLLAWGLSRPFAEWQFSAMGVMGLFAAFGLLLTFAAYRRWLVADFD